MQRSIKDAANAAASCDEVGHWLAGGGGIDRDQVPACNTSAARWALKESCGGGGVHIRGGNVVRINRHAVDSLRSKIRCFQRPDSAYAMTDAYAKITSWRIVAESDRRHAVVGLTRSHKDFIIVGGRTKSDFDGAGGN